MYKKSNFRFTFFTGNLCFFLTLLIFSLANADKSLDFSIGANVSTGNVENIDATCKFNTILINQKHRFTATGLIFYQKFQKEFSRGNLKFTYDRRITQMYTLTFFCSPEYNKPQKLKYRFDNGAGIKKYFFKTDTLMLSISEVLLYSNSYQDTIKTNYFRHSVRPKFDIKKDIIKFGIALYYQPKVDYIKDYRIILDTDLEFKIKEHFSFGISITDEYSSIVPEDVKKNDFILSNEIKIKL